MQKKRKISFRAVLLIWILSASPVFAGYNGNPCERVKDDGSLKVKTADLSGLSELCLCAEVKHLDFVKTSVVRLPDCFGKLADLRSATFRKSALNRMPDDLYDMTALVELDLSFTALNILPRGILTLPNLKILNLRGTAITSLPDGLEHLEKIDMRMIEMNRNQQEAIRDQYPDLKIFFSSPCNCG